MEWVVENVEVGGRMITTRRLKVANEVVASDPAPEVGYSSLTKAALIALAEERGVEVSSRWAKAKIIAALEGED